MAAKRICSDEYADTPKDEAHFMQLRREIKTELEIKDYVGRYINAHPEANADPDAFRKQLIDVPIKSPPVSDCPTQKKIGQKQKERLCLLLWPN